MSLIELSLTTKWLCLFSVTVKDLPVNRRVIVTARSAVVAAVLAEQMIRKAYGDDLPWALHSVSIADDQDAEPNQIDNDDSKLDIQSVGWDWRADQKNPWRRLPKKEAPEGMSDIDLTSEKTVSLLDVYYGPKPKPPKKKTYGHQRGRPPKKKTAKKTSTKKKEGAVKDDEAKGDQTVGS